VNETGTVKYSLQQ